MAGQDWHQRLVGLADEVRTLRRQIAATGRVVYSGWRGRIERQQFAASALNLAHYLVFRQIDLRVLQRRLMALGLSSLGRAEGRVQATLAAVDAALTLMADGPGRAARMPSERQFFRGERQLAANAVGLFGPAPKGRAGRIMVTLGADAAADPDFVRDVAHRAPMLSASTAHTTIRTSGRG